MPVNFTECLDELKLAAIALKRLPPERLPEDTRSHWPEIIRDVRDAYGYDEAQYNRLHATIEQMTALDRVLGWLWAIEPSRRALLLGRAGGMSWRALMRARRRNGQGMRHVSLKAEFRDAALSLWAESRRDTRAKLIVSPLNL
jgi:hypothetical protein